MSEQAKDLRCRVGRHHYVTVADDNPEMRGQAHLECTRCGHVKDPNEYESMKPGVVGWGGEGGG